MGRISSGFIEEKFTDVKTGMKQKRDVIITGEINFNRTLMVAW